MRIPLACLLLAGLAGAVVTATQEPPGQVVVGRGRAGGPPALRTGTAVLVGRVVDGTSASAIAGAVVTITGGGAAAQRVVVDESGRFVFRALPSGDFSVTAVKAGYVGGLAGQRQPTGPSRPVQLADGERVADLTLRLWKAGAIGGTVIDDAGEPVVGIKVSLGERRLVNGKRRLSPAWYSAVMTDDRGMYRFGTVTPGEYFVMARTSEEEIARGLMSLVQGDPGVIVPFAMKAMNGRPEDLLSFEAALRVYPPTFHPSSLTPSGGSVVPIRSGEVRLGVDIRLKLVPIAPVAGTFAGLPEPPQGNPQVRLMLPDPDGGDFEVASAMDSSNGKFTFLAVPSGKYVLRAYQMPRMQQPPGVGPGGIVAGRGRAAGPPPFPTEPSYWASMPVSIGTDDSRSLMVPMRPGATMSGRIEFEGVAPRPERDQLERVLVSLVAENPMSSGMNLRSRVDADGIFRTASLPPGRYRLSVGPLGAWQPKSAMAEGRDLLDDAIDVDTSDVSDVVITFTDRPNGSVNGTVRGAQGAPDPDALVAIFPADPRLRTDFSGSARRMRLARTTKAGQYAIPALPPGEYLVVAGGDELYDTWLEPAALQALARRATRVDISEGGARTQDLKNGSVR